MLSIWLRAFSATLAGTIVLIVWGMVFWGLLAGPLGVFHAIPRADEVTSLLQDAGTTTGTYFFPWPRDTPEAFENFVAQHKSGPFYKLSYITEGVDPNSPRKLAIGSLHHAVVALMAVVILSLANAGRFWARAGIVFLGGMLGTVFITIADPVWFHLPWDYAFGAVIYESVSWALLAVVTAAICRPLSHHAQAANPS